MSTFVCTFAIENETEIPTLKFYRNEKRHNQEGKPFHEGLAEVN